MDDQIVDMMIQLLRDNVIKYHRVLITIVLDRDVGFMSKPWKDFHKEMGT